MTTYTESETGADMCDTCDLWIDGIGANRCMCCTTCEGVGSFESVESADYCRVSVRDNCTDCGGTGRKKEGT